MFVQESYLGAGNCWDKEERLAALRAAPGSLFAIAVGYVAPHPQPFLSPPCGRAKKTHKMQSILAPWKLASMTLTKRKVRRSPFQQKRFAFLGFRRTRFSENFWSSFS